MRRQIVGAEEWTEGPDRERPSEMTRASSGHAREKLSLSGGSCWREVERQIKPPRLRIEKDPEAGSLMPPPPPYAILSSLGRSNHPIPSIQDSEEPEKARPEGTSIGAGDPPPEGGPMPSRRPETGSYLSESPPLSPPLRILARTK